MFGWLCGVKSRKMSSWGIELEPIFDHREQFISSIDELETLLQKDTNLAPIEQPSESDQQNVPETTAAFSSYSRGKVEVMVGILKRMMGKMLNLSPAHSWADLSWLSSILYNRSHVPAIGQAPFEVLYGHTPQLILGPEVESRGIKTRITNTDGATISRRIHDESPFEFNSGISWQRRSIFGTSPSSGGGHTRGTQGHGAQSDDHPSLRKKTTRNRGSDLQRRRGRIGL